MRELYEKVLKEGMNQVIFLREEDFLKDYEDVLSKEEIFWRQKSRETWLAKEDKNTNFFNTNTNIRRNMNRSSLIRKPNIEVLDDPEAISREVVNYFEELINKKMAQDRDPKKISYITF